MPSATPNPGPSSAPRSGQGQEPAPGTPADVAPAATQVSRRESKAAKSARCGEIQQRLAERYPDVTTALDHRSAWELLVATILSAQSTDVAINKVTPELFRRYPTVAGIAGADRAELETLLHPTGFFRNKAKSVQGAAAYLLEHHGGEVPDRMEDLVKLPGVGRKTANVVLGSWFARNEGVVVDTHVGRLSRRLGLTRESDPVKVERDLMKLLPQADWTVFSHRLIWFGREVCAAKDPRCDHCELADLCPSAFKVGRWIEKAPKKGKGKGGKATKPKASARTASARKRG
jgi:endonuclease-3